MRLTLEDIVHAISRLPRNRTYHYVDLSNPHLIQIVDIQLPQGPIRIKRWNPIEGGTPGAARVESMSVQMIARIADSFTEGGMVNFDRVLGGSYNTRSVLEALMAHTPQFYVCYPGRIDRYTRRMVTGHKHLMWLPNEPHAPEVMEHRDTTVVITELPTEYVFNEALTLPETIHEPDIPYEVQRQHALMQIFLVLIASKLGYRSWVAQNDQGIVYGDQRLGEMDGVVQSLSNEPLLSSFGDAVRAGAYIDCIWFGNSRHMPAVFEIEHTTGVTSGLNRMLRFKNLLPDFRSHYVIVAPDEDRQRVIREIHDPQFGELQAFYFPYSAVEDLLALTQRRQIRGITSNFIETYIEQ